MINLVINRDCLSAMRAMEDNAFDLAVVDPPYGISVGRDKVLNTFGDTCKRLRRYTGTRKNRLSSGAGKLKNRALQNMNCDFDLLLPDDEYFKELFRVSRAQIIWGGNYFDLPPTRCVLCWDKEQPWENFSQWEMAWTSFDYPARIFRHRNAGDGEKKIHPTQKPVALYDWIFKTFAKPGMKCLDTHIGSGSSRIAAYKAGLDFVGYEIDKDYYEAQELRFRNALNGTPDVPENQLKLF